MVSACGNVSLPGTDSGNPPAPGDQTALTTLADAYKEAICNVLTWPRLENDDQAPCYSQFSREECLLGVGNAEIDKNLLLPFPGILDSDATTLEELNALEIDQALQSNLPSGISCLDFIYSLGCEDTEVVAAWQSPSSPDQPNEDPEAFNIEAFFDFPACQNTYNGGAVGSN